MYGEILAKLSMHFINPDDSWVDKTGVFFIPFEERRDLSGS
jgi:hypothetical protein